MPGEGLPARRRPAGAGRPAAAGPRSLVGGKRGGRNRASRAGQHLDAGFSHGDGVLPLRGQAVVLGYDGPAIGELADARLAGIDHRLHRERHPWFEDQPCTGLAVMQDLGLLVELASDAVAAELTHHREAVLLGMALDGSTQVAQTGARTHMADAEPHALMGHVDQAARLDARLADEVHPAAIAVVAVLDHGDVDIEDVPGFEHALAGYAVANLVVDRGADGFGVRLVTRRRIVERRGDRVLNADHVLMAQVVQLSGRYAGPHVGGNEIEHLGSEPARNAHALDLFRALHDYGHWSDYARILG